MRPSVDKRKLASATITHRYWWPQEHSSLSHSTPKGQAGVIALCKQTSDQKVIVLLMLHFLFSITTTTESPSSRLVVRVVYTQIFCSSMKRMCFVDKQLSLLENWKQLFTVNRTRVTLTSCDSCTGVTVFTYSRLRGKHTNWPYVLLGVLCSNINRFSTKNNWGCWSNCMQFDTSYLVLISDASLPQFWCLFRPGCISVNR